VSSRLEPGVDPIVEAQRRGSILLVLRLSNIQLELENTPAMDAPSPYVNTCPPPAKFCPPGPGLGLGMPGPGPMVPYGMSSMAGPLLAGPNASLLATNGGVLAPGAPGQKQQPGGAQPSGAQPGGVVMGPYGPMIMGPNGPVPLNPALAANPGMQPNPLLGRGGPMFGGQGLPPIPP